MRQGMCSQCAESGPLQDYFVHDNKTYCRKCADFPRPDTVPGVTSAQISPAQIIDPTICARCGADNGNAEFQRVGGLPLCPPCRDHVFANPYPSWLKLGLVALLLLLVVALIHGRKYFQVGREMYIGEKLVEKGKYADAVAHLKKTVAVAPGSDKAVLLLAKAALLSGDPDTASDAVRGHNDGQGFEQNSAFREVDSLFGRAASALKDAKKAGELEPQTGQAAEAARLMHRAASTYPEMHALTDALPYYDVGAAFESKDYDRFLSIAQQMWKEHPNLPGVAAEVASALACKYAVTGDPSFKQQAEAMLEKARELSAKSPDDLKNFDEYAERTHYRLSSRVIIDKAEYDKKFGADKTTTKR